MRIYILYIYLFLRAFIYEDDKKNVRITILGEIFLRFRAEDAREELKMFPNI